MSIQGSSGWVPGKIPDKLPVQGQKSAKISAGKGKRRILADITNKIFTRQRMAPDRAWKKDSVKMTGSHDAGRPKSTRKTCMQRGVIIGRDRRAPPSHADQVGQVKNYCFEQNLYHGSRLERPYPKENILDVKNETKSSFNNIDCPRESAVKSSDGSRLFHANHINMPDGSRYIAAQSPNMASRGNFWKLAMQNGGLVVNLLERELAPGAIHTVAEYFPKEEGKSDWFGGVFVETTKVETLGPGMKLYNLKVSDGNHEKKLQVLHYDQWKDFGVPDNINESPIEKLFEAVDKYAGDRPTVVHCRGGVGRTGTFITARTNQKLIDKSVKEGRSWSGKDIEDNTIRNINIGRRARDQQYVQTPQQMEFILEHSRQYVLDKLEQKPSLEQKQKPPLEKKEVSGAPKAFTERLEGSRQAAIDKLYSANVKIGSYVFWPSRSTPGAFGAMQKLSDDKEIDAKRPPTLMTREECEDFTELNEVFGPDRCVLNPEDAAAKLESMPPGSCVVWRKAKWAIWKQEDGTITESRKTEYKTEPHSTSRQVLEAIKENLDTYGPSLEKKEVSGVAKQFSEKLVDNRQAALDKLYSADVKIGSYVFWPSRSTSGAFGAMQKLSDDKEKSTAALLTSEECENFMEQNEVFGSDRSALSRTDAETKLESMPPGSCVVWKKATMVMWKQGDGSITEPQKTRYKTEPHPTSRQVLEAIKEDLDTYSEQ